LIHGISVVSALLLTYSIASAEDAAEKTHETPRATAVPPLFERREVDVHYGWQTLSFDGAALVMGLMEPTSSGASFLGPIALGTYLLGGPAVHLYHGHLDRAAGSLGLRAAMPVAGAFIGFAVADAINSSNFPRDPWDNMGGILIGMVTGVAGASFLDAFVLAQEKVEVFEPHRTGTVKSWSPTVGLGPREATIGIQGTLF